MKTHKGMELKNKKNCFQPDPLFDPFSVSVLSANILNFYSQSKYEKSLMK